MGEALRTHLAARHALQPVVTNGGSRVQAFVRIAGFEQPARLCVMAPHAGIAVSLQLETNGQRIPLPVIPAEGLAVMEVLDAAQRSAASGSVIAL